MYESFYKFRTTPFSLMPDPEFFFLSTRHKQGLTHLEYGLYNRALFTLLTGEPGTGKTTLLNKILALNSGRFTVGVITTTHPDAGSLLPWVADAFGLHCPGQDTAGYFRALTAFLGRSFAAGEQVLLVVDEAHNLTIHMLEGLRLLSNINDGRQSSIQIILAGQPSLRTLLASSDMRQLAQRITVDYALEPLNKGEAHAYVQHRLRVAGGEPDLLTEYACALVHQLSGGNPRLINQLCDLALMYGFGAGVDYITASLLWQAAVDRAQGGILPVVVDPRTLLLDPARLRQESQEHVPKPVPVPEPVPQDTPAPSVAAVHKNGSQGGILPTVVDPRALLLDPARLSQESQARVPKPVPVPVPVPPDTPAPSVAAVHQNASSECYREGLGLKQDGWYREALKKFEEAERDITAALLWQGAVDRAQGGILPVVVDPRALLLDPARLNQESQRRGSKPVPVPVPVSPDTPTPPAAAVHKNASREWYREGLGLKQDGWYRKALKKFEEAERDITAALLWQGAVDRAQGGILPVVVDPRALLLDPARLNQESQGRGSKPVPVPVPVSPDTPAPPAAAVHQNQNASREWYREGLGLKQDGWYRKALKKFEAAAQRKLMFCLYLGLSTFIVAHIVYAFVAPARLVPDMPPPPLPSQDGALQHSVSPQQLAQDLMARGLFALPAEFSQSAGSLTGAGLGPPLEAAKKLLLHGTALGIGDEPMAIVQDLADKKQKLLHLHDRVPNVGEVVSIEKIRVLFQDRGREEWLELAMLTDLEQARRMPPLPESSQGRPLAVSPPPYSTLPTGPARVVSMTAGVSSAGSSRPIQIIDRREIYKALSNMPHLLLQALPEVSMIDGRFNGIILGAVRADGLYAQMGLQSDDVLKRINGVELREPSMVISALEQMKNEHRVKLDLVRNETPRTFTYEIR